ncbi:MAG: glycoside hydrolase family 18, partial [Paenibacillus sp.]|nr:glycoside hydrolase family 18 [Paenibacillus sp.]
MKKRSLSVSLAASLGLFMLLSLFAPNIGLAADLTTKYRVYQNDVALSEFASLQQATQYAQWFHNSYVEEIGTRNWVYSNFPRYRVYQYDQTAPSWNYFTLNEAINQAKKLDHASIRDLQGTGWVWNNYPRYRLMQDEITLDTWEFSTLQEAINASKYYTHTHVIDLTTNRWVWDNIPASDKEQRRAGPAQYRLYQGTYTEPTWTFAYLEDAIIQAFYWSNSRVERIDNKKTVYTNYSSYKVYQGDTYVKDFVSMDDAIYWAQWYSNIRIKQNDKEIWNNSPFYRVYQKDAFVSEHNQLSYALYYATHYTNASVRGYDGKTIWNN